MLMKFYLEDLFSEEYLRKVAEITSNEYYVNMMRAWYFATALAKQYTSTLPYIEEKRLDVWTHNKSIQKAIESKRLSKEQKEYLKNEKSKESNNENYVKTFPKASVFTCNPSEKRKKKLCRLSI